MSKIERRQRRGRHSDGSNSRKDSLSSVQNDGADTRPADLVRHLEDQVRREFITRQHQAELNAKLQDEYDQLRKRLAEAEIYIDQLRLGASVKFDKKFVFTYERDPMDTSARPTQTKGTYTSSRRRRLSNGTKNGTDNDTSTLSSSARARRAGEESKLMAHLFEVRDLEEQLVALKQQLEARGVTNSDDDRLKELYSLVKGLEEHQQELSKAMAAVNTNEEPLDHKQAQDQSLVADELSRVTGELQQLQQMIAQYSSPAPSQQEASLEEKKQESPLSSETTSVTTMGKQSEMVAADTLHSSVPEEYLIRTGTPLSSQSHDLDDSKYCTSVTSTLSNLSLDNQSARQRSVSSLDSTPHVSTATNVDEGHDATPTEDCAGGSEWSETSSLSSPLPCSEQTPLIEQRTLVSSTSDRNNNDNDAICQPRPPSNDQSTSTKSQQPSRIPVLAKHLRQEPLSDAAVVNYDSTAVPSYQSTRKPVNFDDLTLNSAHHQQPMLSKIPVLNRPMSPNSYYRPPSPFNSAGATRRAGVGGRYPSPHTASKFSHFVANESNAPSPGRAGRETLPRDDKDSDSSSISGNRRPDHPPSTANGNNEGIKDLQDELKSLRQLLEQQQQQKQQKPVGVDPSSFQFPFWQPGQFPFSSPVHSGTTHGNSVPPMQQGSVPPTHKDSVTSNHGEHVPSTHGGSNEHSDGESVTVLSDSSSSHKSHHTTSVATSEPSPAEPHPLTSKVAMDTIAQQQHAQPVSTNGVTNKQHHPKRKTNKTPSHKNSKQQRNISSPSPEVQHSDLSDSTISSLTSSDVSTLSVFNSARLSPTQLGGFQGDNPLATGTMRVPSNANLSTWVCPLCGGRSVIINSSGTRQHRHRQPEKAKTQSRSTQCNRASYRHSGQSPRRYPHHEKSVGTKDKFSKPRYTPNVKSSGLHCNSDVSSNRSSGLHYNSDVPGNRSNGLRHNGDPLSNRSSSLHRNGDPLSYRSNGLHYNRDMPGNRSSGLHHSYTPPVQSSGLHYSSDTPGLRSSGSQHKTRTPGIRSSVLHYNSDTPVLRSTATQYNSRNRSYRKPRSLRTFKDDTVTFTHPKATSTPVIVHTHDYSSDSSDVCSSPMIIHQPTDYTVSESRPRRRRYHVRRHISRCCHDDGYITTSSDEGDELLYHPAAFRSHSHHYSPLLTEARSHATHVSLDEACRLARRLKRRSEKMYSNLSLELSAH